MGLEQAVDLTSELELLQEMEKEVISVGSDRGKRLVATTSVSRESDPNLVKIMEALNSLTQEVQKLKMQAFPIVQPTPVTTGGESTPPYQACNRAQERSQLQAVLEKLQ